MWQQVQIGFDSNTGWILKQWTGASDQKYYRQSIYMYNSYLCNEHLLNLSNCFVMLVFKYIWKAHSGSLATFDSSLLARCTERGRTWLLTALFLHIFSPLLFPSFFFVILTQTLRSCAQCNCWFWFRLSVCDRLFFHVLWFSEIRLTLIIHFS